jgi:hypothetical protein
VSEAVKQVVEQFQEIVGADGGQVRMIGVEGDLLRVSYKPGHNEQCASCVISPENLRDMLLDVLPGHDASIRRVDVETV